MKGGRSHLLEKAILEFSVRRDLYDPFDGRPGASGAC